eukprot:TRINITY_DN3712_c0_g1_i1.p1 TRINITY_DN3712_c0_g1~~TRINITY_DN3712_c0_g1_i1.p1  ORF type:complete len:806 (+),score=283.36 TRINITY_DN3712_c0_g1_i1:99-2516(+)
MDKKLDFVPADGIERASHLAQYNQKIISQYFEQYNGEQVQFAELIKFHKTEKSINRKTHKEHLLLIGRFRFAVFKGHIVTSKKKKVSKSVHLFDIRAVSVTSDAVMHLTLEDGSTFHLVCLKDPVQTFSLIIYAIRMGHSMITASAEYNKRGHISINVPDQSYILDLPPIVRGPAGGLYNAYISSSNYSKHSFVHDDFVEHIRHIENSGEDFLDLRFLPGPDPRSDSYLGIHTVLFSLTHNNHIKTLIIKDIALQTGSLFGLHKIQYGNLLGKAQISKLFRYNTTLSKLIVFHPSTGGADLDWEIMDSAIKENPENKIQYLDISENKLNLRQIYSISKTIAGLNHGIKVLKLINCNLNDRGLNFVIRALEHHDVCLTLEELDLSQNLFAEASTAHFATYLKNVAEYSKLRILGLRNTQMLFKMVLPWFRVVTSLESLDISMNRLDRVVPEDVGYLLHIPNLTYLNLASDYIFEDAIFGLLSAKPPNQHRKMRLNLQGNIVSGWEVVAKSLSELVYGIEWLDLSGMRLRAKGVAKILPILTERCKGLTRLNIGKNLVSSSESPLMFEAVVEYLQKNPQLKRLAIGSDHLSPSHKDGIAILFEYLDQNSTLEDLDISENYLGDRIFLRLVQSLKVNKGLKTIRIEKNNLSFNAYLSLKHCLEKNNSTLEEVPWPRHDYRQAYKPLNKVRRLRFVHIMQDITTLLQRNRGGRRSKFVEEAKVEDLHQPINGLIPLTSDLPERLRPTSSDHSKVPSFPMTGHTENDLEPLPEDSEFNRNESRPRSYSVGTEGTDSSFESATEEPRMVEA